MAYGDIGAPVNTREYDTANIKHPSMVHVSGDIFAIAYEDANGDGMVVSISITDAGVIGANIIESLKFDEADGHEVSMVHVEGDIFAIAYRGVDANGWVCTVDISTAGAMGVAVEDSWEFEAGNCYEPDMIHVSGSTFAIVYRDASSNGRTTTISIAADGTISASALDTETFVTGRGNYPQIVHVSDDVFAIVHSDGAYDGWVCTVNISADGTISTDAIDSLEFDGSQGTDVSMCHVLGDIFAIAYRGPGDLGFVSTVAISAAGGMGAGVKDSLEFDSTKCTWPDIIHIGGGICAIAYGGELNDGYMCTAQVETDGQIGAAVIDSEEFDISNGMQPSIIQVSGDQYAIAYQGVNDDGFIKTPTIVTPTEGRIKHLMIMGVG